MLSAYDPPSATGIPSHAGNPPRAEVFDGGQIHPLTTTVDMELAVDQEVGGEGVWWEVFKDIIEFLLLREMDFKFEFIMSIIMMMILQLTFREKTKTHIAPSSTGPNWRFICTR
jgi:hypothetical protein